MRRRCSASCRTRRSRSSRESTLIDRLLWRAALVAVAAAGAVALMAVPAPEVPSFARVRAAYRPSDVRLLDRHGAALHELRIDASRRRLAWVRLEQISPALQER